MLLHNGMHLASRHPESARVSGQTLSEVGRPLSPYTREWAGRLVGRIGQGAGGGGAKLQPVVSAKKSFNTPGRRCLEGVGQGGGRRQQREVKGRSSRSLSCPGDCPGLLTLCHVLCPQ